MRNEDLPIGRHVVLEDEKGAVVSGTLLAVEAIVHTKHSDGQEYTHRVRLAPKYYQERPTVPPKKEE